MFAENNPLFCSICGTPNNCEAQFCLHCGSALKNSNTPPAPPPTQPKKKKAGLVIALIVILVIAATFATLVLTHVICLNHKWTAATCTVPSYCQYCNKATGTALGHSWEDATCTTPKKCSLCNLEEGEALGHKMRTYTKKEPTLISSGLDVTACSVCGEIENETTIPKKSVQVDGAQFNFKDEEFIDWINRNSTCEVERTELGMFNNGNNTSYRITMKDGTVGAIIFNHGDNSKTGNICAIMIYFKDIDNAAILGIWLGGKIYSGFSSETAIQKYAYGKDYNTSELCAMTLDLSNDTKVYMVAPYDFLDSLVS